MSTPATPEVSPRARKPRAPKVVKERKKREVPAMTVLRRIALRSSHASEAYVRIVKRDPSFKEAVRVALGNAKTLDEDRSRVQAAEARLNETRELLAESEKEAALYASTLARLDSEAKALADLDTPKGATVTA